MKTIINVECMDQELVITNSPVIASGGKHENFIKFNFCQKWNGLSKIAVFYKNEKNKYYALVDKDNMCEVPHEVTDYEGTMHFGVFGASGNESTKTTKILKYKIVKGAITDNASPSDPTPDIYEQLTNQYNHIIETQAEFIENQEAVMTEFQQYVLDICNRLANGIVETTDTIFPYSVASSLEINEIGGVCVQAEAPSPTNPQEIKKSVVSEIRTHKKNFLKNTHEKETSTNGLTFITNDDGTITINGTATANTNYNLGGNEYPRMSGLYQNLVQIGGTFNGEVKHMAFTKTWGDGGGFQIGKPKPLKENLVYMYFRMVIAEGTVCNNLIVGFMICEDMESSYSYEPYTESSITLSQPVELYGIGDVQDVIENGKVVRKFASVVYDGDENWRASGTLVGRYYLNDVGCVHYANLMCDQAIGLKIATTNPYECYANTSNNPKGRFLINTEFATVEEWKAHLAEHPMTAVYELAEEVIEELPLSDQLALYCLKTFDDITYLEFDSEIEPTFKGRYGSSEIGGVALQAQADNKIGRANSLVNRAEDENNTFEVRVEHGLIYLYKDDVLHGVLGANNVTTNGETYKTMNMRAEENADFIALTNKKTNTVCYYMNINKIPFTSNEYTEAHYFGGDARFTGRVVGNEHIVAKNLQAEQMVFAQAVEASLNLISKGNVTASNNIEAQNELRGKDLHFTNMGVNGGVAQPVEWVWDGVLERWVLCSKQ